MSADDKLAVNDVLVGYFHGFDERRTDDAFLQASFTADAHWRFPRGEVTGSSRSSSAATPRSASGSRLLHSVSSVLVEPFHSRPGRGIGLAEASVLVGPTDLRTPRSLIGGQYSKGASQDRPDGPKVPLVKGQDAPGPEPVREHDHRQDGNAEIQIGVPSIQIERHPIFRPVQRRALIPTCGKVLQKGAPGGRSKPLVEQVVNLQGDRSGDEQAPPLCAENVKDRVSARLVPVGQRHQRRPRR